MEKKNVNYLIAIKMEKVANNAFTKCVDIMKESMKIKEFGVDDIDLNLKKIADEFLELESKIEKVRKAYRLREESPLETFLREGKTGL